MLQEIEYITTGKAAPLLGVKDTRTVVHMIEAGYLAGIRLPSGHWRVTRESVLELARERFQQAS